ILPELHRLGAVRVLRLNEVKLANTDIINMRPLKTLDYLDVSHTALDDGVVDAICEKFPNLTQLLIQETRISEAGVATLRRRLPKCKVHADYSSLGSSP